MSQLGHTRSLQLMDLDNLIIIVRKCQIKRDLCSISLLLRAKIHLKIAFLIIQRV